MGETGSRGVAILGMHRSGTSMLAGTLREAGVYFGRVLDAKFDLNPKGLQEAPAVLYMQENLLEANGGSWHEPPEKTEWKPLHKSVRDLFLESRSGQPLWGFKDPRTLLTLEGWLEVRPDIECVGIFRHPAEVASSIHHRNGFEIEKCFTIWERYNQRLKVFQQAYKFPMIEFVSDHETMERRLKKVLAALKLERKSATAFFESRLKHIEAPGHIIPPSVGRLYDDLRKAAA